MLKDEDFRLELPLVWAVDSADDFLGSLKPDALLFENEKCKVFLAFGLDSVALKRRTQLVELAGRLFEGSVQARGDDQDVLPFFRPAQVASPALQRFCLQLSLSGSGVIVGRRNDDQAALVDYMLGLLGVRLAGLSARSEGSAANALFRLDDSSRVVYVPELALLEEADQSELVVRRKQGYRLIAQTAYQLEPLVDQGLLNLDLQEDLQKNAIPFSLGLFRPVGVSPMFGMAVEKGESSYDIGEAIAGGLKVRDMVQELEIRAIRAAYSVSGGSQMKVAKMLGISRGSLQHKFKKYRLPYEDWR